MSLENELSTTAHEILRLFDRPYNAIEEAPLLPILDRLVRAVRNVPPIGVEPLSEEQVALCIAVAGQTNEWYIYHSGVESNVAGRDLEMEIDDNRTRDGYVALGQLLAAAINLYRMDSATAAHGRCSPLWYRLS